VAVVGARERPGVVDVVLLVRGAVEVEVVVDHVVAAVHAIEREARDLQIGRVARGSGLPLGHLGRVGALDLLVVVLAVGLRERVVVGPALDRDLLGGLRRLGGVG
jgi:hypothetical protein